MQEKEEQIRRAWARLTEGLAILETVNQERQGKVIDTRNKEDLVDLHLHYARRDIEQARTHIDCALEQIGEPQLKGET